VPLQYRVDELIKVVRDSRTAPQRWNIWQAHILAQILQASHAALMSWSYGMSIFRCFATEGMLPALNDITIATRQGSGHGHQHAGQDVGEHMGRGNGGRKTRKQRTWDENHHRYENRVGLCKMWKETFLLTVCK
jgi:hypothetical protein